MKEPGKLLGGILLVSGTTIGAGMLALPVVTGMAGFFPAVILLLVYWAFMTYTAFLMLEVNLWMKDANTNLISMAHVTLGRWAEIVNWILYLALLYLLTTAYISGSGNILSSTLYAFTGREVPQWAGFFPLIFLFAVCVYEGVWMVDYVNRFLMVGLGVTFIVIASLLAPHVSIEALQHEKWPPLILAVSLIATSFGFHIIIPTLVRYFHHDVGQLKKTISIGSVIPILVYIVWEYLTLGILPLEGENGILEGYATGVSGGDLLAGILEGSIITPFILAFSFFAIITSFLGVTISLRDFLADGLHIKKTRAGRILLDGLTFLPPMFLILIDSRAFIWAAQYAGAFCVVTLLALMPALMTWSGRYHHGFKSSFRVPGGKPALILVILLSVTVVAIEIALKVGIYP